MLTVGMVALLGILQPGEVYARCGDSLSNVPWTDRPEWVELVGRRFGIQAIRGLEVFEVQSVERAREVLEILLADREFTMQHGFLLTALERLSRRFVRNEVDQVMLEESGGRHRAFGFGTLYRNGMPIVFGYRVELD